MVDIVTNPEWKAVRILERDEVALGGYGGNMNEQATALVARSEFLKQKLDLSKNGFSNQSFVERLESVTNNNQSYIVKRSDTSISFGCGQFSDWGSEYGMELDPDGMLLVRGGSCNVMEYYSTRHNATNLVGDFSISSTSTTANYAKTIGNTFELSFTGTNLTFQHWSDNRGGMWDVSINGGAPIRVKTYDVSTTGFVKDQVVVTGLSNTTHTAVFTYAGKDPTSAASTHRGWFCQEKSGNITNNTGYVYFDAHPKIVKQRSVRPQLIAYNSIIEFAVRATPVGTSIPSQWCPAHGTVNINVCRNVTREIYIDGVLTSIADISVIPENINSVIIKQTYTAYCPTDTIGAYPLWDGVLTHKYSDGKLAVSHSTDTRTKCTATGYFGMFPTSNAYSNKLIMQDGTSYVVEPVDGSIPFSKPMDTAIFISDTYKSASAFKTNVSNTLNLDSKLYVNGQVFFEKRTDSVNKVYWQTFDNTLLDVGDRFSYTNEYYLSANNPSLNSM